MKVWELVEILKTKPQDMEVYVSMRDLDCYIKAVQVTPEMVFPVITSKESVLLIDYKAR